MLYRVIFVEGGECKSDAFNISAAVNGNALAKEIGDLYERHGVETLGVMRVREVDVDLL